MINREDRQAICEAKILFKPICHFGRENAQTLNDDIAYFGIGIG